MSGFDRNQTPKTRPVDHKRTAMVASLDIGTSKIACMIARLKPSPPSEALRGRTHAVELIGYSQIQSRGVKAGAVVDLAECEQAVRQAVALAERMARVRVESILLSVSGGRLQGQLVEAAADIRGGAVTADDVTRVTSTGMRHATGEGRTVLHALPVGYALDGVKGIRDPRGMLARQFGVDMQVVTVDATVARNLMLVVERCHGGESLCRRPVRADRRRGRSRGRRGRNGRWFDHDRDLFGRPLRPCLGICARWTTCDDGSCTRRRRMHCGCRANQDFIRDRVDRRV
jgi:cell division protein FtsA